MFCRTTRHSPFWPAAALLALLATPHALLAQGAAPTVRVDVTNQTAKPVELALVGPDGKDYGPPRSVQPGKVYQTSNRALPPGSAKGYKWVVRDPYTGRVLKEVLADRAQRSITVGKKSQTAAGEPQQAELLRLINQYRQANGKGPLSMDSRLTRAAQDHTDWMQATGTLSHTGKNRSSDLDRIKAVGASPNAWAENIARNTTPTPQAIFTQWKNSAGHNRNMLGPYRKVGLGSKGGYWTAVLTN
jgi:uncharacterized protein YkwD